MTSLEITVKAILTGMALVFIGSIPRNLLFAANTRLFPTVPWFTFPLCIYIWIYWRYVNGAWFPRSTSAARRANLRANSLGGPVWFWALSAGTIALVALVLLLRVANRIVTMPREASFDVSQISMATVIAMIVVGAISAAVVEESAFRGYMQGLIEKRLGIVAAILISGVMFGLAHLGVTPMLLPYYVSVAALYGMVAYLTDSILPSIVLHTAGNIYSNTFLWLEGHAEWQQSAIPQPLIWETGADRSFWIHVIAAALTVGVTVLAYVQLARVAGRQKKSAPA